MQVRTLLDLIDLGDIALPEFQRGYVWNRGQVRGLMQSLYHGYPIGSLLVWVTGSSDAAVRGESGGVKDTVKLLLDGQQRMTSLYGIVRGMPPRFFDGNAPALTGLQFHLEEEIFEFQAPIKMQGDPLWIDVTELMEKGAGEVTKDLLKTPEFAERLPVYLTRLTSIDNVKNIDLHIQEVTGEDKTVDVVVDIFNRVNSGGTKLSKGDLALARICAIWKEAREEMRASLERWGESGYDFKLDWLLRNVNTVLTGEAMFRRLGR